MEKIRRPVQRVDDPAPRRIFTHGFAAFLHHQPIIGPRLLQLGAQNGFGLAVGFRDEIPRPLAGNLELFDLAEIADQRTRGLPRGAFHDINNSRSAAHGVPALFFTL